MAVMNTDTSAEIQKHIAQADLARLLKVTAPTVNQWVRGVRPVPARHCIAIEDYTGGAVKVEAIRPDLAWQRDPNTGKPTGFSVRI